MLMNDNEYLNTLESIKAEIRSAQYKAAVNVNRELILLYYQIGCPARAISVLIFSPKIPSVR